MSQPQINNSDKASILKTTREAKGLTLEIVHEATKIPMDALRAIEEGYSVRILSPFYYRGFIKIYAEFLGLDVREMYVQYGLDQPATKSASAPASAPISTTKSAKVPTPKPIQKIAPPPQPNVILEQMQGGMTKIFTPKTFKLIFKIIGFLLLLLALFKIVVFVGAFVHKKMASAHQHSVYVESPKPFTQEDNRDEKSAPVPPVVKHEIVQAQSEDQKVEVAVRANRNTWLQVKADGHVVFQMTLTKGSMETWTADTKIELSGRNIEQLDMEVNGKHIGTLGGGERRIRKVLITQEGLTVKK